VRAFAILCYSLGLTPSVDTFLYFFEVKDLGKKLWVSFNGVAGRVLLTLFQQEELLQSPEQSEGPCPSRWVSLILHREAQPSEGLKS